MLSIGLIALLAAACGQQVAGKATAAQNVAAGNPPTIKQTSTRTTLTPMRPPSSSSSSSSSSSTDRLAALVGTWEGEYTCGQGNTGLKLTVKPPEVASVPTTFEFFPLPSNPSAAKGSYTMVGSYLSSGQLTFKQQEWVDQPPGYMMVDLAVTSPVEPGIKQLSGDVLSNSCKGFSVRKR